MVVRVSNWEKLKLLLWKNLLVQRNHLCEIIFEIIVPLLFLSFILNLRTKDANKLIPKRIYNEINISSMDVLKNQTVKFFEETFAFSPENLYLKNIVTHAVHKLGWDTVVGYQNARTLNNELVLKDYIAGIQFDDTLASITNYPKKLSFTLRFPTKKRTQGKPYTWWTQRLYAPALPFQARNFESETDGAPVGYFQEGFIALQHAISMSFIELAGDVNNLPEVVMRRFPYPKFYQDELFPMFANVVPFLLVLDFVLSCTHNSGYIANEKESRIKEVLKIMGLNSWVHWMAWFINSYILFFIPCVIITLLLVVKGGNDVAIFTYSSILPILLFFLVYGMSAISLSLLLATFFSKVSLALAVSGIVWYFTMICYAYAGKDVQASISNTIMSGFIPNTALLLGIDIMFGYESYGEGVQWSNIFTPLNADTKVSLGVLIITMLIGGIIFMVAYLYVDQVNPGGIGISRQWYFPLTQGFWCGKKRTRSFINRPNSQINRNDSEAFEKPSTSKYISLEIRDLEKKFGKEIALKGVSLDLYQDEITVLLGHSGSGRTTLVSIITGMLSATSGTVTINGHDIQKNTDKARKLLGICPDHNALFDEISVINHLIFYCRMKGLKDNAVYREVDKYLTVMGLENEENTVVSKLSSGMKRKLCVCCALCGGTKVVLCDEPSSGLDPQARRKLWDLLKREKVGRTLLITTNFMDEADVLGDSVAIMYNGELKCHGTPFYLKKKFGSGYRLICVKRDNCDVTAVTNFLKEYVQSIEPEGNIGTELSYRLPDSYFSNFSIMFNDLENNLDQLNLDGFGVSVSTLEEVFMKIGAENPIRERPRSSSKIRDRLSARFSIGKVQRYPENSSSNFQIENVENFGPNNKYEIKGLCLFLNHFKAMFIKKFLNTCRNYLYFGLQYILVIVYIVLSSNTLNPKRNADKSSMTMSLLQYPTAVVLFEVKSKVSESNFEFKMAEVYESMFERYDYRDYTVENTFNMNISDYILKLKKKQSIINKKYLAGVTFDLNKITAWFNNQPLHTSPMALNLVHNALARTILGPKATITVSNHPYQVVEMIIDSDTNAGGLASNICFCMCFISAFYIFFIIKEQTSSAKLIQFISGVRIWVFWITHFLWDLFTFSLSVLVLIVTLACLRIQGYSKLYELGLYFSVLMVFGVSSLPLTYLLSFFLKNPLHAFELALFIYAATGVLLFIVYIILKLISNDMRKKAENIIWYFRIFPHFSVANGISNLYKNFVVRAECDNNISKYLHLSYRCELFPECCDIKPFYDWESPGIMPEIVYMLTVGGIMLALVLAHDYHVISWLKRKILFKIMRPHELPKNLQLDEDVEAEKNLIKGMSKAERAEQYLLLDGITKFYNGFLAVNQISLHVKQNECFGLLGVNGAGKTTTFKMMMGDVHITTGEAYIKGASMRTQMRKIYREIGYCPETNPFLGNLTGREILYILCLLRGASKENITDIIENLASSLSFLKDLDKYAKTYSSGNKRKLSIAIALVGSPSVLFLDEPTTGMDPVSKRKLWNVICTVRDSGKAIILTTHSMEECEALCTRVAIMVNGELKCIGALQHLKNNFPKGLVLKIKVKRKKFYNNIFIRRARMNLESNTPMTGYENNVIIVKKAIMEKYETSILQEEHLGLLIYFIPLTDVMWSEIFHFMEENIQKLNIEDYSISQISLEEIFIEFAKYQRLDTRGKGESFWSLCQCCC